MADFNTNQIDRIAMVVERAREFCFTPAMEEPVQLTMDLCAADGVNGNPDLDLSALLKFEWPDFLHDVAGIYRHLDRTTGKLTDCFVPRCAE